jgi:patatin-related protein
MPNQTRTASPDAPLLINRTKAVDSDVTELRIALVCFGGVSLAIYMHGITKEIAALLRASRAFDAALVVAGDADPSPGELPEAGTERAYFAQLVELWRAGLPISANVDVITGTSAGGINGICLAQAAVCGSSQDALTELWMQRGDIGGLMRYGRLGRLAGEIATAVALPVKAASKWSPLKGDDMCRWLYGALADMESAKSPDNPTTLLPEGSGLDLFVTTTDLRGTDQVVPVGAGGGLHDRTYRRVFAFHYEPQADDAIDARAPSTGGLGTNTIGKGQAWPLALAARATSSFPGAFPPISVADFADAIGKLPAEARQNAYTAASFAARFMPEYDLLPNGDPANAYMMDGGVLDNEPFDHAIAAIATKPAGRETIRHLVYIEPAPGNASPGANAATLSAVDRETSSSNAVPTWLGGVKAALFTIPHHQPLLGAVQQLADVNQQVTMVGRIALDLENSVTELLAPHGVTDPGAAVDMTYQDLTARAGAVYDSVPKIVGSLNYRTYGQLKMQQIMERLACDVATRLSFPAGSSQAGFLRLAFVDWMHVQPPWNAPDLDVQKWLGPLDLPYRERRLKFIIAGINVLFDRSTRARVSNTNMGATPSRQQLATLKRDAWNLLLRERAKSAEAVAALPSSMTMFASSRDLGQQELLTDPSIWAAKHAQHIGDLVDAYRTVIGRLTANSASDLWNAFETAVRSWPAGNERNLVAGRYVQFPVWDALLFPMQWFSRLPIFNPIGATRFSPDDATALKPTLPGKLEGVATHHFGAFFKLERRQNDYLWGRLDGAELILRLLRDQYENRRAPNDAALPRQDAILNSAITAVLDQEQQHLNKISHRIAELRTQLPTA